ncbi:MAG: LacI family transcriptional regulator [Anaerolineae bacterium]|nr:LacI family transcriptional regulator [Anaerolineae bacterium]
MKRRPTQTDVARLAGVSRATVSYVVNGIDASQVSSATRQRVLQAVDALGYQPDALAQSLRSGWTNTIGLLIPDMDNPHYWHIAKGVEHVAQAEQYDLLLISSSLDVDREMHSIRALSRRRIDGLILIVSYFEEVRAEIQQSHQHRPVVLLNTFIEGFDYVQIQSDVGVHDLMTHLLGLGHRRIGFVYGVANPQIGRNRLMLYEQALQQAGLRVDDRLIATCGTTVEDGYRTTQRILEAEPRPTALVVINDLLAMGALRAAADRGLRVPEDLSIASFDDINLARYTLPRLTTVAVDSTALGQTAARLLFQRLRDPNRAPQHQTIASRLIVRASTGPVPDSDGLR